MAGPKEEQELLERAQGGDTAAAQILFLRNDDVLRRHVESVIGEAGVSVDEVVRRAVHRAGKDLRRFKLEGKHPFRDGLLAVATDQCARTLVAAAQTGDTAAADVLFSMYEDEVKQYLRGRIAGIFKQVDDLHVEARWAHVRERMEPKLATFDYRQKNGVVAYLTKIAKHLCDDEARIHKPGNDKQLEKLSVWMSDGDPSPSSVLAREERANALRAAIPALNSDQLMAVQLFLEGKTVAEIAAAMNKTPGAVRMLLKRAKERLHDEFGRTSMWYSSR